MKNKHELCFDLFWLMALTHSNKLLRTTAFCLSEVALSVAWDYEFSLLEEKHHLRTFRRCRTSQKKVYVVCHVLFTWSKYMYIVSVCLLMERNPRNVFHDLRQRHLYVSHLGFVHIKTHASIKSSHVVSDYVNTTRLGRDMIEERLGLVITIQGLQIGTCRQWTYGPCEIVNPWS